MSTKPIYDDTVPIACTIDRAEMPGRIERVERMRHSHTRIERTEHGLVLHFPNRPDIHADLSRFAVEEKQCCQFFGFAVETSENDLTLRWDGPPATDGFMEDLCAYMQGDKALTDIAELL